MKRFAKLVVLSVAVASLGLAGTAATQAQQTEQRSTLPSGRSLVGGIWATGNKESDKIAVMKFNDDGRMVLAFIKKESKQVDSKSGGRYTLSGDDLVVNLDNGEELRFTLTWIDDETMDLTFRGNKGRWIRIKD